MGYKALINLNINKAFDLIEDLADDVVLTKKLASSFNFSTIEAKVSTSETVTTKAIITDIKKQSSEHSALYKSAMFKTQDIGDINAYDTLVIDNQNWKVGPLTRSDRFITVVEIYKEV